MAEKVHFLPVDLRVHRSQVIDLNCEFMDWMLREITKYFGIDLLAKSAVSVRDYVTGMVEKLCSAPHGIYYLLEIEETIIGMGALHQVRKNIAEIKRMYIRPTYRGKGYGKALLQQLMQKAKEFGYHSIYLESGPFMTTAHNLYRSVGFVERSEYPETEVPPQLRSKWLYMEKTLEDTSK
ncbi:MAG: GNAT family N-acetyltransferase [Candidatus Bathyarchaeota archaeon]|nr:GNAT family N-acetyltransferase [Candidatus Bathyarchaeota archaeon]